jgi:hypothetical protein
MSGGVTDAILPLSGIDKIHRSGVYPWDMRVVLYAIIDVRPNVVVGYLYERVHY